MVNPAPHLGPVQWQDVAGKAYEAYVRSVGGTAVNGDPLPAWEVVKERRPKIAQAWVKAVMAVERALVDMTSQQSGQELGLRVLPKGATLSDPVRQEEVDGLAHKGSPSAKEPKV